MSDFIGRKFEYKGDKKIVLDLSNHFPKENEDLGKLEWMDSPKHLAHYNQFTFTVMSEDGHPERKAHYVKLDTLDMYDGCIVLLSNHFIARCDTIEG